MDRHEQDEHPRPTTNEPLNAPGRRPLLPAVLAVVGLVVVVAIVFLLLTWVQQNT